MMKLLTILLLFSLNINAQFGDWGLLSQTAPASGFNWANLTPQSPTLYNSGNCSSGTPIVIENKSFTNLNSGVQSGFNVFVGGTAGNLLNCNITFKNCYFGPSFNVALQVDYFIGTIRVENCLFASNRTGVRITECPGVVAQIYNCQFVNVWGAPYCTGQSVQFVNVISDGDSYIKNCTMENFRGEGSTEDHISMFNSSGTGALPIVISGNYARGGGPSTSGGGFMGGDSGGSWQLFENNRLFNPGNYIYAISGGTNVTHRNSFGLQQSFPWTNIATYVYNVAAATCSGHTFQGNSIGFPNGNIFYTDNRECGNITGIGTTGNDNNDFLLSNVTSLTVANYGFPATIINFVDVDRLWHIRDEAVQFRDDTGPCIAAGVPVLTTIPRPVSNAGADQNITISTATLSGSGSTSTNGFNYKWVQVSGPNTATMAGQFAVTNNLSGLINGTYEFRLEVTDNSSASDADWMTVTVNVPTFHFATAGDDSRTATQAQNSSTPWKTLTKLNSYFSTLTNNAVVALNRGDTFDGNIQVSRSGLSATVPITITAYGSGADPIVTGFTSVTAWTNLGSNIWESTSAVSTLSTLNMVVINGVNTVMGRTPNSGYFTYQTHVSNTSITSTDVNSGIINWTGAEAVIRKEPYITERNPITAHSGGTLTYSGGGSSGTNGYGFYIQNDVRTLDAVNEWYYNPSTKKIRIYNTVSPTNVQVASIENLVLTNQFDNITFDNISFQGSNGNGLVVAGAGNLVIQNCSIDFSGKDAIWGVQNFGPSCAGFKFQNSIINHSNNNAIYMADEFTGALISNNVISNTGIYDGMGAYGTDTKLVAIRIRGASTIIENNIIDNVGYNGIMFEQSNVIVRNNFITNFCTQKIDGGGIYSWYGGSFSIYTGQKIYNNIVLDGIGSNVGTTQVGTPIVHGIYMDDGIANIEIYNNTSAGNSYSGMYLHNTNNINAHDNTFYNNVSYQMLITSYLSGFPTRSLTLLSNIAFSKASTQKAVSWQSGVNDITSFGSAASINSNYYARPIDDNLTIETMVNDAPTQRTLAGWKTYSGFDALGNKSPQTITDVADLRFEYNATNSPVTVTLSFPYIDVRGVVYSTAITLPAYGSAVLIKQSL